MKKSIAFLLILFAALSAFAGEEKSGRHHKDNALQDEIEAILDEYSETAISDLTFGQIEDIMGRLSVPMQEAAYVKRSKMASMIIPGAGQFINGEALSGTLFLVADVAVAAGTMVGAYFLLPSELHFDQLDYLNSSHTEIKTAWKTAMENATLAEMLPLAGVMTGGMLLHHLVSGFSARNAGQLARENIESGKVTFEPKLNFGGKMGMGFSMKY